MADACPNIELYPAEGDVQSRIDELERQIEAQRRVNEILIKRIAKSVDIEGGAFSLHEQNTQLQHSVEQRSLQLESINRQLRQEISERKMIEQALRISEERYRFLMEESQQPFVVAREFEFIYANPAAAQLFGYATPQELLSAGMKSVVPEDELVVRQKRFKMRVLGEDADHRYEARFIRTDGRVLWCEVNARVGEFEGGMAILAGLHDITDRKHAAAELARSNAILRSTLESTADGILVVDDHGQITTFNEKFLEMWRITPPVSFTSHRELLSRVVEQVQSPEQFLARIEDLYAMPGAESFDVIEFADGRVVERYSLPHRLDGDCLGRVWSFRDVTDRIRAEQMRQGLEAQLRQAQKMEAIGTLAGGIAHDFNNILYAIQGYAELVLDNLPEGSLERRDQQEVLVASKRAADLVRQILAFSRQSNAQSSAVDVGEIAREVLRLVRASLPSSIELHFDRSDEDLVVMADSTHVHQILMNLCTNAGHALGEEGGVLEVTLRSEVVTPGAAAACEGSLDAGNYVVIAVRDNGCGIDEAVRQRIFDPFFTTKEVGVGTGLGLATVHGIVKSLGGHIDFDSQVGAGSEFRVYLPRTEGRLSAVVDEALVTPQGSGHIMFVEDEEPLARMCSEALQRCGYTVEAYTSSVLALECFQESPEKYDLLITDQTMPDLTGYKLTEQILAIRPDLPVILCTGFSKTITPSTAKALGISALLEKPIGIRDLAAAVSRALGEKLAKVA